MAECNKRKFWTRTDAVQFASNHRKGVSRKHQRPYACEDPECQSMGFWHLTSMPSEHMSYYRNQRRIQRKRKR